MPRLVLITIVIPQADAVGCRFGDVIKIQLIFIIINVDIFTYLIKMKDMMVRCI